MAFSGFFMAFPLGLLYEMTCLAEEDLQQVASGAIAHEMQLIHYERPEELLELA